jgi:hypothetical protein
MTDMTNPDTLDIKAKWKAFAVNQHLAVEHQAHVPIEQIEACEIFDKLQSFSGKLEGHDDTGLSFHVDAVLEDLGVTLRCPWHDMCSILAVESIVAMASTAQACEQEP